MENQVVKIATDWWVIETTGLASIITTLVTVITVYFTFVVFLKLLTN